MSNPQPKPTTKVTATFDKSEAEKFLTPLADFQRVCGTKLSLQFNKDNTLTIKAINDSKNVITYIDYLAEGLPNLKVVEECTGHIFELDEFVSISKIFNNGLEFTYNETDKCLELSSGDEEVNQSFRYYLCDETVIGKCPKSLNTSKINWLAQFKWDTKKYANFVKGMSSLKHPYVIIEGSKDDNKLTMSVTENKMKTTTLKTSIKLDKPNVESFRIVLNKENFLNPVTSSVTTFDLNISQKLVSLTGQSAYHKVQYYVTTVVESAE